MESPKEIRPITIVLLSKGSKTIYYDVGWTHQNEVGHKVIIFKSGGKGVGLN